jgi:hypothetical protein
VDKTPIRALKTRAVVVYDTRSSNCRRNEQRFNVRVREMVNHKFMQSVDKNVYNELTALAKARGVSVQELLRAVIIADWMRSNGMHSRKPAFKNKN